MTYPHTYTVPQRQRNFSNFYSFFFFLSGIAASSLPPTSLEASPGKQSTMLRLGRGIRGKSFIRQLSRRVNTMAGGGEGGPAVASSSSFDPFRFDRSPILDNPFSKIQPVEEPSRVFERVRCRQHVNPLAAMHQVLPNLPSWSDEDRVFEDPSLPLYIDLGCGSGRFLLQLALKHKGKANFLGIEIRAPLAHRANHWREEFGVKNAYVLDGNINVQGAWDRVLKGYPGPISGISALMPDPWFKKRHKKRRMFNTDLVESIANSLEVGGGCFIQSDIKAVAIDMRRQLAENPSFVDVTNKCNEAVKIEDCTDDDDGESKEDAKDPVLEELKKSWLWLSENPTGVATEREKYVMEQRGHVWRALFRKT